MAKAVWRPATRDAFALEHDEDNEEMGHRRQHEDAEYDMNRPKDVSAAYLQSAQGARLGEESGAAFQHRAGNENPYLVGGVVSRRGSLPPDPNHPDLPTNHNDAARRSYMYDGEISLGFADEDFYIVEAERADGVSFAGSRMSRRSSTRSGAAAMALPMAHVRDPAASGSTSQQLSPRSDAGDAGHGMYQHQVHQGQTFHTYHTTAPPQPPTVAPQGGQSPAEGRDNNNNYWTTADHRGRPMSASKPQQPHHHAPLPLPGGVSPRPPLAGARVGGQAPPPPPGYTSAGVGDATAAAASATPAAQRPLSGSVRRQSAAAVTWDIFEDVDVVELERVRSSSRLAPHPIPASGASAAPPSLPGSMNINDLFGLSAPPPLPPPPPQPGRAAEAAAPPAPPRRTSAGSMRRVSATSVPSSDYLWDAEIDAEIFDV
jgi:hypothetical protein